LSDKQSDLSNI